MAKRLGIGSHLLENPRTIRNADGTINASGPLNRFTDLEVYYSGISEVQRFYITNLGEDRAIFGFPWLQTFQPDIDWRNAHIEGKAELYTTNLEPPPWMKISQIAMETKRTNFEEGDEIHMMIGRTNVAQQWAQKTHEGKELMTEASIPTQYKDFTDVFSEEAARRFPPARDDDHPIDFKPTAPDTFSCKIYPISAKETEFLRGWIDENLGKNFIRESRSPYASPTFLIKKKNGDFRVIQDYRTLNEHTIPDVSPLPLIGSLIEKLHG